jgi:hypothetical protein
MALFLVVSAFNETVLDISGKNNRTIMGYTTHGGGNQRVHPTGIWLGKRSPMLMVSMVHLLVAAQQRT